ncbi:MAG: UbiA family prenyltransferase [Chitinivibrionales bacterium]|nr:UbiA family prenyltransferase [Chitinivibrionales bacterium]
MRATLFDYVFLMRIPLLAPVWTICILGWITGRQGCRVGDGLLRRGDSGPLWLVLAAFSCIVASIYIVNQIADRESDRINHKLFLLPQGIVSPANAWIVAALCAVAGLLLSLFFNRAISILFLISLIIGYLYDLPPADLRNRPWGGLAANFLGHGVLTYLVGWCAAQQAYLGDVLLLKQGIFASLSPGFANAAVFLATTIPDAEGDRVCRKRTFCVAYGPTATALTSAVCCFASLGFAFLLPHNGWVMILPAATSCFLFVIFAVKADNRSALYAFKWPVFLLTVSVALFVPLYALLILATFWGSRIYYRRRFNILYPTFKSQ